MQFEDELSQYYSKIIDATYECADRIVINGYYRPGYSGGGFRKWRTLLKGSDDDPDNNHLKGALKLRYLKIFVNFLLKWDGISYFRGKARRNLSASMRGRSESSVLYSMDKQE